MTLWTKRPYGSDITTGGNWTITNGHLNFDVHLSIDGSISKSLTRHPGPKHYIVSPQEADFYAEQIVKALNKCTVKNGIIMLEKHHNNLSK